MIGRKEECKPVMYFKMNNLSDIIIMIVKLLKGDKEIYLFYRKSRYEMF